MNRQDAKKDKYKIKNNRTAKIAKHAKKFQELKQNTYFHRPDIKLR